MVCITFKGQTFTITAEETLLDGVLRQGEVIPFSCKSGTCQTCMVQTESTAVSSGWQSGLKDTYKARGYFLACLCKPSTDISIALPSLDESSIMTTVIEKKQLCHNVIALRLKPDTAFDCIAGQYVSLIRPDDGLARSYSIANLLDNDGYIECHIRKIPDGKMSCWLHDAVMPGMDLRVRGPAGECFYVNPSREPFDMVLAATGTGLAPLYGIIRDAIKQQHVGQITIIHGALNAADLYYVTELRVLAEAYPQMRYLPCVLTDVDNMHHATVAAIDKVMASQLATPASTRLYVCGIPDMVKKLKKTAFLAGVSSKHIYSDPFLPTKN